MTSWSRATTLALLVGLSSNPALAELPASSGTPAIDRAAAAAAPVAGAPVDRTPPAQVSEQTSELTNLFRSARYDGQLRSYVVATANVGDLQDWASWAVGANLGVQSGRWNGLAVGLRVYGVSEVIGNSDVRDPITGKSSRYELGLFDITNENTTQVGLLGEAYLDFRVPGHQVWAGRHLLKSPLINPQDGRMIPTLVQGVWYTNTSFSHTTLQLGYLSHIAPRGTTGFSSVGDSIGLSSSGKATDGTPSNYAGNVETKGVLVVSAGYKTPVLELEAWDYLVENVFNTAYVETNVRPLLGKVRLRWGLQGIAQQRIGSGGNDDPALRYFEQGESWTLGSLLGFETPRGWAARLSGSWISDAGRFLFPREWGREPLFTFQKRERSEGSGEELSFVLEGGKSWLFRDGAKYETWLSYGQHRRPPTSQPALNKYALPSLYQIAWDSSYSFAGALKGLSAELLVIYKGSLDGERPNPTDRLNKVDMMTWNFIINYSF